MGGSSRGGAGVGLLLARAYGYEWVPETGLYHVGARVYDPRTARWLQRDPIDADSGDPNLYRYAGNAPLGYQDPNGLKPANKKRWGRKNCEDLYQSLSQSLQKYG